jgi:hypothetical protein
LARTEELELFDIAWKSVSGDENGDDAAPEPGSGQEAAFVDDRHNLGENGTTDEDSSKEVGP